ncbi:hypothetical protein HRbin01_00582 [archaeon HR01]|nr:hypothetical protein HRbin01_00582 [archaeon HR01]
MSFRIRIPSIWRAKRFLYRLEGYRCSRCGEFHTHSRYVCRRCRSRELTLERLPTRVRLVDYTVVHQATRNNEDNLPFIVGLVETPDGVKILGQITDCEPEDLAPGMELETTFRRIGVDGDANIIVYGYKFRPEIH